LSAFKHSFAICFFLILMPVFLSQYHPVFQVVNMNGAELTALQKAADKVDKAKAVNDGVAPKLFAMVGMTQAEFAIYGNHITLKDVIPPNCRLVTINDPAPEANQPSTSEPDTPSLTASQPSSSTTVKHTTSHRTRQTKSTAPKQATAIDLMSTITPPRAKKDTPASSTPAQASTSSSIATFSALNTLRAAIQSSNKELEHLAAAAAAPANGSA
jgi:hypothetical protein